ncbi:ABC transporter permease [Microlunatus sp. Y2014]|uniref:ABC transporter permease n=1 Tax=Microlunatus sp. Y2014 TaxID=3418488 RepID=UPI003DA76BF2
MSVDALDLSPAPTPRSRGGNVWRHGLTDAALQLRNGEQLLLTVLIPVGLLVIGHFFARDLLPIEQLAPSVMALALWSSCFTGTAIATGFERRYGVLERLAATPLTRAGLILGKTLGVVIICAIQVLLLITVSVLLGWRPSPTAVDLVVLPLTTLGAMISFVACALIMAGRLRAEVTLALANVVYLTLAVGGGLVAPLATYPGPLAVIAGLLPTGALGEAWRSFSTGAADGPAAFWPVAVVAVWAALTTLVASKVFRWMS